MPFFSVLFSKPKTSSDLSKIPLSLPFEINSRIFSGVARLAMSISCGGGMGSIDSRFFICVIEIFLSIRAIRFLSIL